MITQEDLIFLNEAKRAFAQNITLVTYRNEEETHIALRRGTDCESIEIYRLNGRVAYFDKQLEPLPF